MWRGYGGNGNGAAIVFDSGKINTQDGSPLILARVEYGSVDERVDWLKKLADRVAQLVTKYRVPDEKLYLLSHAAFERIKLFAIFTKHHGFKEEREWRIAYLSERDTNGAFKSVLAYTNGQRGIEPKLKFKIKPIAGLTAPDLSLEKIISSILLGPTISSPLAKRAIERMLDIANKPTFKDRLQTSSIPFRPSIQ